MIIFASECYRDIEMQHFVDETLRKLTTMRNVDEDEIFHAFLMRLTVLDDKTIS
jgi:hypothetical protein